MYLQDNVATFYTRAYYAGISINNSNEVGCLLLPHVLGSTIVSQDVMRAVFVIPNAKNIRQVGYGATTKDGSEVIVYPKFPVTPNTSIFDEQMTALSNFIRCPGYSASTLVDLSGVYSFNDYLTHFPTISTPAYGTTWHIDLNIYKDISSQINN